MELLSANMRIYISYYYMEYYYTGVNIYFYIHNNYNILYNIILLLTIYFKNARWHYFYFCGFCTRVVRLNIKYSWSSVIYLLNSVYFYILIRHGEKNIKNYKSQHRSLLYTNSSRMQPKSQYCYNI